MWSWIPDTVISRHTQSTVMTTMAGPVIADRFPVMLALARSSRFNPWPAGLITRACWAPLPCVRQIVRFEYRLQAQRSSLHWGKLAEVNASTVPAAVTTKISHSRQMIHGIAATTNCTMATRYPVHHSRSRDARPAVPSGSALKTEMQRPALERCAFANTASNSCRTGEGIQWVSKSRRIRPRIQD